MLSDCGALTDILASGARTARMCLRPVHRHGLLAELRRREPAHVQPQLSRPQRHEGRAGLPRVPGDGGRRRAHRLHHRPADLGEMPAVDAAGTASASTTRAVLPASRRRKRTTWRSCADRTSSPFPQQQAPCRQHRVQSCARRSATTSRPTTSCPPVRRSCRYRSNIPKLSELCFAVCDPTFPARAKAAGTSIIVGGSNYGQGSSREHAALVPLYLGVNAASWPRASRASTRQTSSTPASCR